MRVPPVEKHLGYLLRRVSNAASGAFARALKQEQTSIAEWVVLREVYERGQVSPGELAELLGVTRGAVSKIIDKLEAKGWVHASAKSDDSRFRVISVSQSGRRSAPALAAIADRNDASYFDCLSEREQSSLRSILVKLAECNAIHDVPME